MSSEAKTEIVIDPELAQNYARIKNVSLEEATERLRENFAKEANVDVGQRLIALRNGFAKLQPQVQGLINRETDYANGIAQLKNEVKRLDNLNADLHKRLDFERQVYKQSMHILNGIVEEDAKTQARIAALEASSVPLLKRIVNRIKCLLNN